MARRKSSHKSPFVKAVTVGIRLSAEEFAALVRLTELESQRRREVLHEGSLVRELVMVRVRELLAAADAETEAANQPQAMVG